MEEYQYQPKNNQKYLPLFIALALIVAFVLSMITFILTSYAYRSGVFATTASESRIVKLAEVVGALEREFYLDFDEDELTNAAARGLVEGLGDPYTVFMTAEEHKSYMESATGEYSGIGAVVTILKDINGVGIVSPIEGSPAEAAGLVSGDVIIKIDDYDTTENNIDEAVKRLKGKAGTTVNLTVFKKDTEEMKEITLTRAEIKDRPVRSEMKDGNIGYIRIIQFTNNTSIDLETAMKELESAKGIILDLRDNPGGLVDEAIAVADMFLPFDKTVVYTMNKQGEREDYMTGEAAVNDTPLVVLVNEGSASASEILSGALQDHGRAKIVGTKTFGKGLIQRTLSIPTGDFLKVTIAEFFTPNGNAINQEGVTPDYVTPDKDGQLQKAMELLR